MVLRDLQDQAERPDFVTIDQSELGTTQLRQQAACFDQKDGVLYRRVVDAETSTTRLQRVLITKEEKT